MGQSAEIPTHRHLLSQYQQFKYCPTTNTYFNISTSQTFFSQSFNFKSTQNKQLIDNYYKSRKALTSDKATQSHLFKLLEYEIYEDKNKKEESSQTFRIFSDRNICSMTARGSTRQDFTVLLFFQILETSLQDQIFKRIGKKAFQEIQLWSVLSSCVLGAVSLLQQGLKQPMLSPKSIGLSKEGFIKVSQWELIPQIELNKEEKEEGEIFIGQTIQSKDQLTKILLSYYWPPQGIKTMEQITNLGRKKASTLPIQIYNNAPKSQIFSLGMTLISMCLRNCFYRIQTYSEKYLQKLINQAIQIRKIQGKPLSKLMEKVIRQTVKWDPNDRISYFKLKEIILEHFSQNQSSQTIQSQVLSISHFSEDLSEQISRKEIFMAEKSTNKFFISEIVDENKKYSISINKASFESSFASGNFIDGSGTIEQGVGDEYEPLQEDKEQFIQNKGKKSLRVEQSYTSKNSKNSAREPRRSNRLKSSLLSYRSVQRKDDNNEYSSQRNSENDGLLINSSIVQKQQQKLKNIGKIIQSNQIDFEDDPQKIVNYFEGNSVVEENRDMFEEYEQGSILQSDRTYSTHGAHLHYSPNFYENPPLAPNTHQTSVKLAFGLQDSPIYQQDNRYDDESSSQLQQSLKKSTSNLFTDPKLLQFIRSPINSLQNTVHYSQINPYQNKRSQSEFHSFGKQNKNIENAGTQNNSQPIKTPKQKQSEWIRVETESATASNNSHKTGDGTGRIVKEEMKNGFYQGKKKNGYRSGYGVFYYNEGGKYRGNWLNNKMHGKGVLQYADGRTAYEGQWHSDQLHGHGILYNEAPRNTNRMLDYRNIEGLQDYWVYYDGEFQNDDKSGIGSLILTNGQVFKGSFKEDLAHGYGEYFQLNGEVVKGLWEKNLFIGRID